MMTPVANNIRTVADLIVALSHCPINAPVCVESGNQEAYGDIVEVIADKENVCLVFGTPSDEL